MSIKNSFLFILVLAFYSPVIAQEKNSSNTHLSPKTKLLIASYTENITKAQLQDYVTHNIGGKTYLSALIKIDLDEKNTLQIMNIIKKVSQDCLVIMVTHERRLAEFYADTIIHHRRHLR